MIELVLEELSKTDFDFRKFANPSDPFAEHFEEWVSYYRLKFCIAKALKPRSILEVGVRFGYSARTFLEASPDAKLLGIDLDCDRFGGQPGALRWAHKITANYDADFMVADSQKMKRYPGGVYDLIHVDGQQDGSGSFHDLRRAVSQGRWVLLDGYFWTRDNFLNANDFLLKYKDTICYVLTIPGYAGELLIRVSEEHLARAGSMLSAGAGASGEIKPFYDSNYYLNDCGGYQAFRQSGGKQLTDRRLVSLLNLCGLARGGNALDLGCGRGELSFQLALSGATVTAVDYSAAAIELARSCFKDQDAALRDRVVFICGDVTRLNLGRKFDLAIAGDVIEHLGPIEVSTLFETVARHLKEDGIFVVHTYPNVWFYRKHWSRLRAAAGKLGAHLPAEPRTRYELLMHINEQSPATLRRSLAKAFAHVYVWVGRSEAPGENLLRGCSLSELISAPEIYALASQSPLDLDRAKSFLTQSELPNGTHARVTLEIIDYPAHVAAGSMFQVRAVLTNKSESTLSSMPPYPVNISYHWFIEGTDHFAIFDGLRTMLRQGVEPGDIREVGARVQAPLHVGRYRLLLTLVQEGCCWFGSVAKCAESCAHITVA